MDLQEINVVFTDATETAICASGGVQDPEVYPYQGVVTTADSRYVTYYFTFPVFMRSSMIAATDADGNPLTEPPGTAAAA